MSELEYIIAYDTWKEGRRKPTLRKAIRDLFSDPAPIIFITGHHGFGKTDFSLYLAEQLLNMGMVDEVATNIRTEEPAIKFISDLCTLKLWLRHSKKPKLYIFDEAGIYLSSRRPLSKLNVDVLHEVLKARKYRAKLIFISQRSRDIESAIRDTDIWLATFKKINKTTAELIANLPQPEYWFPIRFKNIPPTSIPYDTYDIAPFTLRPEQLQPESEEQRLLMMWIEDDNISFRQISRLTGIPVTTVIRWIKQAVRELVVIAGFLKQS